MAGTAQGENGWYVAPDGLVYYFILNENNWLLAAGPVSFEKYDEIMQTQVRVVHGHNYVNKDTNSNGYDSDSDRNRISKSVSGSIRKRESEALIRCKFDLCIERTDLDGAVFMDKKTRALYLAVSVEKLLKKSDVVLR